ncbi:origin recognition complex subunit 4 [Coemansia sp. RSA 2706]|nr:origin recognition complex subunit 4 [Coemansia sp. RSA 2706]
MPARQPSATDADVRSIKRAVLGRLYGRAPLPTLVGLDAAVDAVHTLLRQTVASSEGNTALVVGPRGSGKTAVVERALARLGEHSGAHHVVRLSGFVHTSDRLALRDIARQLLATQDLEHVLVGSFADAFAYILGLLRTSRGAGGPVAPVLFVLEEFDLLAQHPKQALLYALFDVAQSQQTPVAVLGLTARIDAVDLLEKRVKSRFSHRQIFVHGAASLEDFAQIAACALRVDAARDGPVAGALALQFNRRVADILAAAPVAQHVASLFEFGKDARQLLRVFAPAVARISAAAPLPDVAAVEASVAMDAASAKMQVLAAVSLLELCLVAAMKSLVQAGCCRYNFEMVYSEYKTFMSRHMVAVAAGGVMRIYKKPVALKAFEALVELEIVRPVLPLAAAAEGPATAHARNDLLAGSAAAARAPKEFRMVQLMLDPGQVVELVAARADVPTVIRRWVQQ